MRNVFHLSFLVLLYSFCISARAFSPKADVHIQIKVVTEDTFPVQYIENGKVTGPATALVEQVLVAANVKYDIEVLPWARAYNLALSEPNVLIYSLARTSAREKQFHWLGRIMALEYYLYGGLDSNIDFTTPISELTQYRVGAVRDSAVDQYLRGKGFEKLTTVIKGTQNFHLFEQNRIDLLPANQSSFQAICLQYAFNCQELKPVHKLDISSADLYMAFSQLTDAALVEKVQAAYKQVINQRTPLLDPKVIDSKSIDE